MSLLSQDEAVLYAGLCIDAVLYAGLCTEAVLYAGLCIEAVLYAGLCIEAVLYAGLYIAFSLDQAEVMLNHKIGRGCFIISLL